MKWCACAPADIMWVALDNEYVAFHRPSGKTHFLNDASRVLLTEVLRVPRSFDVILNSFGTEVAGEDATAYREQMKGMLDRLESLGLIERA